jgi:hypothetical protein
MQFGVCLPNFAFGVQLTPTAMVEVARAGERLHEARDFRGRRGSGDIFEWTGVETSI